MLGGYINVREWRIWTWGGARWEKQCRFWGGMLRMWSVGCGVLDVECWMWNVGCEMMDVECGIWNGASGTGMFSHGSQLDTEPCELLLSKNTDFTDAHGWVFSRIVYSCSAAYCLVFDAPPARQIDTDFFAGGKYNEVVCHMTGLGMRSDGHAPKGQKFIAQGKRSGALGIMCRVACAL